MARSAEVIRQWEILRSIDRARHGIGVAKLAGERGVHPRTIRRDIDALCRAGFPLFDSKVNGTSMWTLTARPFRAIEELGLSLMELCALYFSQTLLTSLAGAPLLTDAERAFHKLEKALPRGCRQFVDRLPRVLNARVTGRKKQDDRKIREILARVLDAILLHRQATMRYASASSKRTKEYVVEPQRVAYAHGGIYLVAWVPEYAEMRTFAVERMQTFGLRDEGFQPRALPVQPFAHSLGVHTGRPETVVVEFEPDVAPYVREREWHQTQTIEDRDDGSIVLRMQVCNDHALRAWVLSFGASARVVAPGALASAIVEQATATRRRYLPPARGHARMLAIKAS